MWLEAILWQGCFVAIVLAIGWSLAASMRRAERLRILSSRRSQQLQGFETAVSNHEHSCKDASKQPGSASRLPLPALSVVLPVRGCRPHSRLSWSSTLNMEYGGPVEFIFVLDSHTDPAYQVVQELISSHARRDSVRVCIAGPAFACSQKIFNLVCGCRSSSSVSQYVLFLDDDVELHPQCAQQLVAGLEQDASLFMATGYPFDLPPSANSSLATYCVLVYHLPLVIAFSVKQRTQFVWGGCMLLRRSNLIPDDQYGVLKVWLDGGYSDDLLLAALCTERKLAISVPSYAIFPQWLQSQYSWPQYLNYLHRQLYVLDTYATPHNKYLNHTMMGIHAWASAMWAASVVVVAWCLGGCLVRSLFRVPRWLDQDEVVSHAAASVGVSGTSLASFLICWAASHMALLWMTGEVVALLSVLSPSRPLVPSATQHLSFWRLWTAFFIESCLLPLCIMYTLCFPDIQWGGIRYRKCKGKVTREQSIFEANSKCL